MVYPLVNRSWPKVQGPRAAPLAASTVAQGPRRRTLSAHVRYPEPRAEDHAPRTSVGGAGNMAGGYLGRLPPSHRPIADPHPPANRPLRSEHGPWLSGAQKKSLVISFGSGAITDQGPRSLDRCAWAAGRGQNRMPFVNMKWQRVSVIESPHWTLGWLTCSTNTVHASGSPVGSS